MAEPIRCLKCGRDLMTAPSKWEGTGYVCRDNCQPARAPVGLEGLLVALKEEMIEGWRDSTTPTTFGVVSSLIEALVNSCVPVQDPADRAWDAATGVVERAPLEPEESDTRTVRSIAAMLGWANVPPRRTLEMDISALKARAVAETPPAGWQPIATAPKDEGCVVLFLDGSGVLPGYWDEEVQAWLSCETQGLTGGRWHSEPTHWMPLPAEPGQARETAPYPRTCRKCGRAWAEANDECTFWNLHGVAAPPAQEPT